MKKKHLWYGFLGLAVLGLVSGQYSEYKDRVHAENLGFENVTQMQNAQRDGFKTGEEYAQYLNAMKAAKEAEAERLRLEEQAKLELLKREEEERRAEDMAREEEERLQRVAKSRGYKTVEEMQEAEKRGWRNARLEKQGVALGFSTQGEYERHLAAERKRTALKRNKANYQNAEFLKDKYWSDAEVRCRRQIERLAKWDFEWTNRWSERRFNSYRTTVKEANVLTIFGDRIKFQNGFGAWQHVSYGCDYNVKTKTAMGFIK